MDQDLTLVVTASRTWSRLVGYAVAAGAVVSCFGTLNGWILLQGEVPLAMARNMLLFVTFGRVVNHYDIRTDGR